MSLYNRTTIKALGLGRKSSVHTFLPSASFGHVCHIVIIFIAEVLILRHYQKYCELGTYNCIAITDFILCACVAEAQMEGEKSLRWIHACMHLSHQCIL